MTTSPSGGVLDVSAWPISPEALDHLGCQWPPDGIAVQRYELGRWNFADPELDGHTIVSSRRCGVIVCRWISKGR